MTKLVLDVGNCDPDHAAITRLVRRHFAAEVVRAHLPADALAQLRARAFDLVLVNRKLDADYSDGVEVIRQMKPAPDLCSVPVMLVTNYAEHQGVAQALGAELGFGKLEFDLPETIAKLARHLGAPVATSG